MAEINYLTVQQKASLALLILQLGLHSVVEQLVTWYGVTAVTRALEASR